MMDIVWPFFFDPLPPHTPRLFSSFLGVNDLLKLTFSSMFFGIRRGRIDYKEWHNLVSMSHFSVKQEAEAVGGRWDRLQRRGVISSPPPYILGPPLLLLEGEVGGQEIYFSTFTAHLTSYCVCE